MRNMTPSPFTHRSGTARHSAFPAPRSPFQNAFTRTEVLCLLAMLTLLLAIVLPALAHDRARSSRIICANNLRQISAAQQLWGNDHNDLPPVMVPVNEGGTRAHPLAVNTWIHFAALSNELVSARVLSCPSDTGPMAEDFSNAQGRGYLNPNYRNSATSYFVAYSGVSNDPQWAVIGGDRNITFDTYGACGLLNYANGIIRNSSAGGHWSTNLHNLNGNVMIRDGRVEMVSSTELRNLLDQHADDGPSTKHVAIPR